MSVNWIKHTPSTTPDIKHDEDVAHVDDAHIKAFFQAVHWQFMHTNAAYEPLPKDLEDETRNCSVQSLTAVLTKAVAGGSLMDTGWLDNYFKICQLVSETAGGYPKVCIKQWRALRDAIAGRWGEDSYFDGSHLRKGSKEDEKIVPFRFLDLPEHIRQRIYSLVIPNDTLTISDWAIASMPQSIFRRTEYDVPDPNEENRRTTYVVHSSRPRQTDLNLNLMLANRSTYNEAAQLLYSSTFNFRGTASGTLAFLHDHMKALSRIKKISVKYTTTSKTPFLGCTWVNSTPPPTLKTNLDVWKKIVNRLISSASALEDFTLVIDKNFWTLSPWKSGSSTILSSKTLCEPSSPQRSVRNFLAEVSRLSGVNFRLVVEGEGDDRLKKELRKELEKDICERIYKRPYLAVKSAACSCRKRLLSEACAWDEGGGKRRKD